MVTLQGVLLSAALSLPPPWYPPGENPETRSQYEARLETITEAVAKEAQAARGWVWGPRALAFAALTLMYNESRFAVAVHSGEKLGDRGLASCLGQIHSNGLIPKPEWEQLTGVDIQSTRRCARATIRMLIVQHRSCGLHKHSLSVEGIARMFAAYASGSSCKITPSARKRAEAWHRMTYR